MNDSRGEKRPLPAQNSFLEGVKAILIDVEGVMTPISFGKEVLIPYAKEHLKTYLETNFENEDLLKQIDAIRSKVLSDKEANVDGAETIPAADAEKEAVVSAVVKHVLAKIDGELEASTRLLLDLLWQDAYKTDSIQGELYDDVVPLLRMLVSDGIKVFSYSANSIDSQKMLFSFSNQGDINELFVGHFDSSTDRSSDRFTNIAAKIEQRTTEILYLTHSHTEANAANESGMKTCLVLREGNEPVSDEQLQSVLAVYSLDELWDDEYDEGEVPAKRLHGDADPALYYGDYSTDGATNDSEADEFGHNPPHDVVGESEENGDSEDAA
jgi:enolase-phosphatase E1